MMKTQNCRLGSEFAAYVSHSQHPSAKAVELAFEGSALQPALPDSCQVYLDVPFGHLYSIFLFLQETTF